MKVLIVEQEKPDYENLVQQLLLLDETIEISACGTVKECVKWVETNDHPDLIFMDIHLSDGLCFDIFRQTSISCPVIFTTVYDKYLKEAFTFNCIDYLRKPIGSDRLRTALRKYRNLQSYFLNNYSSLTAYLNNQNHDKKKSMVIVRKGVAYQPIRIEDVVYFFTEQKLVFLVDKSNTKYVADKNNLGEVEEDLDEFVFYRANRKYIISAKFVKGFKQLDRKVAIELMIPVKEEIMVSQENVVSFKKWINNI